jgi:hypothetical protein
MRPALLGIALALLVAGCGGGKSAAPVSSTAPPKTTSTVQTTTNTTSVKLHGRFHYPPVLIRNYMRSCVRSAKRSSQQSGTGAANFTAYCACTLDKLSNNVSTRDFAEIGLSGGRIPPRIKRFMSNAVADCADKL